MDKKILNEIHRNKELMGLNEQGVIDAVKRGAEKGKEFVKGLFNKDEEGNETTETKSPIKTEEYNQTTINTYDDYITVEASTPSSDRETAQKMITKTAEDKNLGKQTKRQVLTLEEGGYKIIAFFNKK